jgi:hypothetical protein
LNTLQIETEHRFGNLRKRRKCYTRLAEEYFHTDEASPWANAFPKTATTTNIVTNAKRRVMITMIGSKSKIQIFFLFKNFCKEQLFVTLSVNQTLLRLKFKGNQTLVVKRSFGHYWSFSMSYCALKKHFFRLTVNL